MSLHLAQNGGNLMNKLLKTLIIGLPLLAFASVAQAGHEPRVAVQGSITVGVPIGPNGYAVVGVAPAYYPQPVYYPVPRYYAAPRYYTAPYPVYRDARYRHHHNKHGWKHGKSHKKGYKKGKHGRY